MIISLVKIFPRHEKRQEAQDILLAVKGPTLAAAGCLSVSCYEEHDDEESILYVELWQSLSELERHVRSSSYAKVLAAIELSACQPEITFSETGKTWGFELVERLRGNVMPRCPDKLQA